MSKRKQPCERCGYTIRHGWVFRRGFYCSRDCMAQGSKGRAR